MNNSKNIILAIVIFALGIAIGKFVFSNNQASENSGEKDSTEDTKKVEHWTCSMHPQIDMPEPGDCPICGMDLIPMKEGGSNDNPLVLEMSEDAMKLSNIQTTTVGMGSEDSENGGMRLSGRIKSDESLSASIVSHIPGRIEKLYVSFTGETIRKGQKLARIYSPNLITAQKELLEAKKMEDINPKLLEATVNKLKFWRITDAQIQKILSENKVQESFIIYAEHSGIVSQRKVSVGDHLMEGGVLFDTQNLSKLWVLFDVYENNLSSLKLGDKIQFTTPSVAHKIFEAPITFINPIIDPKTRVATVRVEVQNKGNILKPEMFVNGMLMKNNGSSTTQMTIPKSAVLWTGERSVVYVKLPNVSVPSFEFKEIILGAAIGNQYIVTDGLTMGDEVVTKGAFVIDASAQLNNQSSMMNRNINGAEVKKVLPDYTSSTPIEFKKQLKSLNEKYLNLKNNLVATDPIKAKESAQSFSTELTKVDMSLVDGKAHMYWMDRMKELKDKAMGISMADDVEVQRSMFDELSQEIIDASTVFGVVDATYYVEFCPMANDNKGAYWLSAESVIKNPYYGDAMMKCGSLKDTLGVD